MSNSSRISDERYDVLSVTTFVAIMHYLPIRGESNRYT